MNLMPFSSDNTGARWCYTLSRTCNDLRYSQTRRDAYGNPRMWSYEACSTPEPYSAYCRGSGGSYYDPRSLGLRG